MFQKVAEGYIGFVEELPGANTQDITMAEVRTNIEEAVSLVLETNRAMTEESLKGTTVIREAMQVTAA